MSLLDKRKLGRKGLCVGKFDQPCAECEEPMIGIIKLNIQPEHEDTINHLTRTICAPCLEALGKDPDDTTNYK